jgi:hypothetical protein
MHLFRPRTCVRSLLLAMACVAAPLFAQTDTTVRRDSTVAADSGSMTEAIKAFLDCQGATSQGCDRQFFVLELPFVTWTRDRLFADVQFLVTTIQTGSGAFEYTATAIGRGRFANRIDTLVVRTIPNEPEDRIRRKLARAFKILLVPYLRNSAIADRIRVEYDSPNQGRQLTPGAVKDRWNFFVYQMRLNGFMSAESQLRSGSFFGNATARRTTEKLSMRFGINQNSRFNRFQVDDSTTVSNTIRGGTAFGRVVQAITSRWSVGAITNVGYSEFQNTALFVRAAPVIEYNIFPWSQATTQQVTFAYGVGPRYFRWDDTTIFGRTRESRWQQELVIASDVRKSWGNVNITTRYASYLPDLKKWTLGVDGETSLNIVKGLQFNVGGGATLIRDQIFLAARNRTRDQILTQQRALASNYSLFVFTGLSYSFGSIYNSVVNPRLEAFTLGGNSN